MLCQVLVTESSTWLPTPIAFVGLLLFFSLNNFDHVPGFFFFFLKMKLLKMAEKYFIRAICLLAYLQHVKFWTETSIDSSMFNNVFITMVFPEQLGLLNFGNKTAKARK